MVPLAVALLHDKCHLGNNTTFRRIDSTPAVDAVGLKNRAEYEHVKQLVTNSAEKFLNYYLPGGETNVKVTLLKSQRQGMWAGRNFWVYLWGGYIICLSTTPPNRTDGPTPGHYSDHVDSYTGLWINWEDGVYGENLLELFIYRTKSHPGDAHRALARQYGWDLSSKAILFQSQKLAYSQSPTIPEDFDFTQAVPFIKESGCSVHGVYKYRNRTGAIRGAMVYCLSADETELLPIPVVQNERVHPNDKDVLYPGLSKVPFDNCINPSLRCQVHGYPPHVERRPEISFFQSPYPIYKEEELGIKGVAAILISQDEPSTDKLNAFLKNQRISGYIPISWPGGENTVQDVDWSPLEGCKVGYAIHQDDKRSCRLAYAAYRSVKPVAPSEFRFHLNIKNNDMPDSVEKVESFASNYTSLSLDSFVQYVRERHGISLTGDTQTAAATLKAFTVEEYTNQDMAPPDYVLDHILPSPSTAEFFGPRGIGKTFGTLEVAKAIATGGTAFGRWKAPIPRPVLYIDGEMSAQEMSKRAKLLNLREAGERLKIMSASTQDRPIKDLSTPEGQADIERCLKEHQTEVIFIDNISALAPKALGNDVECCLPLMAWVADLKRRGYTVILIHHAGKGNGGRGGTQRGTSAKEDILDLVISLEMPRQKRNQAHFNVVITKARSAYGEAIEPFTVTLTTSEGEESAQWEVGDYLNGKANKANPTVGGRPKMSTEERQSLLSEIERYYRETTYTIEVIAQKLGFKNRAAFYNFLKESPNDYERLKGIRVSSRSKAVNVKAPPQVPAISETTPAFPN